MTLDRVDLQQLRCFLAVAREGHFGRAAERLHLTTSPVSRAVKDLERELGAELFVRRYHRVELTAGGRHLQSRLEPIVAELDGLRAEVRHLARGAAHALRIGATTAAPAQVLDGVVEVAEKVEPDRPVEVTLASSVELCSAVARGDLDLAVTHLDLLTPDLPLAALQIISYTTVAVMRVDDPVAGQDELRVADLVGHTFVMMVDSPESHTIQKMRRDFTARGVDRVETVPVGDVAMTVSKVRRRGSFTLLARESDLLRMFDESRFATVPLVDIPSRGAGVIWRTVDGHPGEKVAEIVSRLEGAGVEIGSVG